MNHFSFWQRWLFVVGLIIAIFGFVMALASGTPLFDLFNRQINPVFWGTNSLGAAATQFQQWIYGVWGATIAGWGIFVAFLARHAFQKREKWARNCMACGLIVWFILDTALSFFYQVYFNVAFNAGLLILTMMPIVFTRKDFSSSE